MPWAALVITGPRGIMGLVVRLVELGVVSLCGLLSFLLHALRCQAPARNDEGVDCLAPFSRLGGACWRLPPPGTAAHLHHEGSPECRGCRRSGEVSKRKFGNPFIPKPQAQKLVCGGAGGFGNKVWRVDPCFGHSPTDSSVRVHHGAAGGATHPPDPTPPREVSLLAETLPDERLAMGGGDACKKNFFLRGHCPWARAPQATLSLEYEGDEAVRRTRSVSAAGAHRGPGRRRRCALGPGGGGGPFKRPRPLPPALPASFLREARRAGPGGGAAGAPHPPPLPPPSISGSKRKRQPRVARSTGGGRPGFGGGGECGFVSSQGHPRVLHLLLSWSARPGAPAHPSVMVVGGCHEKASYCPDPGWASISRGVLVCDECCSVHRSLGRHISIVKHLRHSAWPPTLLQMVHTLASNGANSIWEHSLLDPAQVQSGRRKANPQDKVHPIKSEFIRAKYQMLAFVHKLPCRDDDGVTAKDLSKQLHSSVRTGNLETCLRLLSLGAQANFFHPEKGTTPLHVAAKAGQTLQAELLVVYGADPGSPDVNGRTPIDYARQAGHHELAERLVECQYELTDRLAFYLCGRKPDHKNGHYIIPQMADSLDLSELAKAAKKKLQALSNRLFEELAMDVYDEVDRRENDAVWLATQNHSTLVTERSAVPFLPVNPEYSATRNQGRQKLARFNAREFATLIIDILSEAKRRQQGKSLGSPTDNLELSTRGQSDLDDQHDYDSVASDEDTDQEPLRSAGATRNNRARSMDSSDLSDGAVTLQEYLELKKALAASEAKVQQLMKVNSSLSDELRRLQREIHKLQAENLQIRQPPGPMPTPPLPSERAEHAPVGPGGSTHRRDRQAFSMYEPGSALKPFGVPPGDELTTRLQPFHSTELEDDAIYSVHVPAGLYRIRKGVSASAVPFTPSSPLLSCSQEGSRHTSKLSRHGSGADSDYENTQSGDPLLGLEGKRFLELGKEEDFHPELESLDGDLDPGLPSTEDVILKTEQVTKNIQELLRAAQEFKHDSFVPCSEKIHLAVTEMASLFPKRPALEPVRSSLRLLNASAYRLQSECRKTVPPEPGAPVDFQLLTQQVIQCAYDIAKAAKQLVTITTREKKQ
ncbi:TPA: ARF GTPase-activating protein GIT1-like [Bos taurus]|nr:TPA: ARF GTPase-activating protein GIT1-like [Bos taurus]